MFVTTAVKYLDATADVVVTELDEYDHTFSPGPQTGCGEKAPLPRSSLSPMHANVTVSVGQPVPTTSSVSYDDSHVSTCTVVPAGMTAPASIMMNAA